MMTKIQLSDFKYVDRPKRLGRSQGLALRFTWALSVELASGERGEFAMEGCLCYRDGAKQLKWSPPVSTWGNGKSQQMHWINPVFYKLTLEALRDTKFVDHIDTPMQRLIEKAEESRAQNMDATLPKLLEVEG